MTLSLSSVAAGGKPALAAALARHERESSEDLAKAPLVKAAPAPDRSALSPLALAATLGGRPGTMTFHCLVYDPVDNAYVFIAGNKTWAYRWKK